MTENCDRMVPVSICALKLNAIVDAVETPIVPSEGLEAVTPNDAVENDQE